MERRKRILIVDDDELFARSLSMQLEKDYEIEMVTSGNSGLRSISQREPDLMLLDITLPEMDGLEILGRVKKIRPGLPVIMLTAVETIPTIVASIRMGAYDYVTKPIQPEELFITISRALEASELKKENEQARNLQLSMNESFHIVGQSPSLDEVRRQIALVGQSDSIVLIEGESGTGKELVARQIHAQSARASRPFVAINCGALPKDLIESEFFGYRKGAFTGAASNQVGKVQLADKGTLLLDEIGELPMEAQSKLLRVLDRQEFYPVGGTELIQVDVRIIASTNRNLKEMAQNGLFREDLYYRLNVFQISIAPLRNRRQDILDLARHFLESYNVKFGKHFKTFSDETKTCLLNHSWNGNVRELRNIIERIVLTEDCETIEKAHVENLLRGSLTKFSDHIGFRLPPDGIDLEDFEKKLLFQALEMANGNKTQAASLLKMTTPTFTYRLEKYKIS
jgi:DNA-binding NtrC family response regulator